MKILITPSVKETHKDQYDYLVDSRLIKFLCFAFNNAEVTILNNTTNHKDPYDLLVLSGGNDLFTIKKKRSNYLRNEIDKKHVQNAIKRSIPILGVCYGAQFLSNMFGGELVKTKNHVKTIHEIYFKNTEYIKNKKLRVNSFHNFAIINKKNRIMEIAKAKDNTIEFFKIRNKKIFGIMWHPERNKQFKNYDISILNKICN